MTTWIVGTTPGIATVSAALAAAVDGDTVQIPAGLWVENFPRITAAITIQGIGGMAHLQTPGQPVNGKAILVIAGTVTLDHIELSGATVPDANGAGIRYEGGHLTLTHCWLHDNENGLLAAPVPGGSITIDRSEFGNNGNGNGLTHNLYVNRIATLTVTNSYFHDAQGGHEIKSRAETTIITGNRIQDGPTAATSYSIDLPDGGVGTISGNVIQKGPAAPNSTFIHFGGEAVPSYAGSTLAITGNSFINDRVGGTPRILRNQTQDPGGANYPASIDGNTIWRVDPAGMVVGLASIGSNSFPTGASPVLDTSHPFSVPCFVAGTWIATARGAVAVERLEPGMMVRLAGGGVAPVRWVGRLDIDVGGHPAAAPVRVLEGAFGPGRPGRDLLLSPDHAVLVGAVLIPIGTLVNGRSVVAQPARAVSYFHVELPRHAVLLAEGLAAESYLDVGNRAAFGNATDVPAANDSMAALWAERACAPQLRAGPAHAALRHRLAEGRLRA